MNVIERIGQEFNSVRTEVADVESSIESKISLVASNVLINNESLAIAMTTIVKGFVAETYTGNGSSQLVVTGVGSFDLTDTNGNTNEIWHDRATGDGTMKVRTLTDVTTNGTFDTDLSGWSEAGGSTWIWSSGRAYHQLSGSLITLSQNVGSGKTFEVTFDAEIVSGTAKFIRNSGSGQDAELLEISSTGSYSIQVNTDTSTHLAFARKTSAEFYVDNVVFNEVTYVEQTSGEYACANNEFISDVLIKSLTNTSGDDRWYREDGLRGANKYLSTNLNLAELTNAGHSFNSNGYTVGAGVVINQSGVDYVLYQTIYTHIKWGLTSQGKKYIEAFNPISGMNLIFYRGSGLANHIMPHSLGTKMTYFDTKTLNTANDWYSTYQEGSGMNLNLTGGETSDSSLPSEFTDTHVTMNNASVTNLASTSYVFYGRVKSKNWTLVPYDGNGSSNNFVEVRDVQGIPRAPRRVTLKRLDSTSNWSVFDSARGNDGYVVYFNLSNIEDTTDYLDFKQNGFTIKSSSATFNASGGNYIASVEFDTNSNGGDGYFDFPTDNTNLNVTTGRFLFTENINKSGYIKSSEELTGSVDFSTANDGLNWVARVKGSGWRFETRRPSVGLYTKTSSDDNRLVFNTTEGKWYETIGTAIYENDGTNLSGWNSNAVSVFDVSNEQLHFIANANTGGINRDIAGLTIGEEYVIEFSYNTVTNNAYSNALNLSLPVGGGKVVHSFTAESTVFNLDFVENSPSNNTEFYLDNLLVYKKEATLGSALVTPLSFLEYPFMVSSGTPQEERTDVAPLAFNTMKSLEVEGLSKLNGNRKVIELGTIFNDNRYVIDNPFGNDNYEHCEARVEVFENNVWSDAGWFDEAGLRRGTKGGVTSEGIIIQTAQDAVTTTGNISGSLHGGNSSPASAPARVIVTYIGEAK